MARSASTRCVPFLMATLSAGNRLLAARLPLKQNALPMRERPHAPLPDHAKRRLLPPCRHA